APLMSPLSDDEDRRTLRAIIRGAFAGIPAADRMDGVIPTATLPPRAIDQLARAVDLPALAATLMAIRHPFGSAVAAEAHRQHPDLFLLDAALARAFAARATAEARR